MSFRWSVSEPARSPLGLADVPLRELAAELKRRGWELLPAGVWKRVVGDLEQQVAEHRREPDGKQWFDGTQVVRKLAHLGGHVLPECVERVRELGDENITLRGRAHRAEAEADLLTQQLIGDDLAQLEHGDDDE